ncbi:extracellular solute-binding protein [Paenibacillus sp. ISL-20]|uniref:ABC transporter substrate-binding protein n=1 Tax=Paenibacillus sp. ISL-20 TaxID=2819163 RepID=UPI001BE8E7B6|nr:extracellular solute-binding protein [Paenibacillus sp. ISL-20]MBT2762116.1 extracellular solute-binding protein [Paenibacillus sp. ISL-20]
MKKFGLWMAVCCALVFTLTACGSGSSSDSGTSIGSDASTDSNKAASGAGADEKDSNTGGNKTIVFSTFFLDERFQAAKKKYEKLHPNIEIKLEYVETDDAHMEAEMEKYITTTNTAMLAGKGPDLLQMDLLPTDNYVKHNLLADLGTMMDQDSSLRKEDYFTNILDAVRTDDGLYSMPLSFFLMGFAGDEDAITKSGIKVDDKAWSWEDFTEIANQLVATKTNGYSSALIYGSPENLLADIVLDNYSLYVDKASGTAQFDIDRFMSLMDQVKTMYVNHIINTDYRNGAYFRNIQINSPWDYLVSLREYGENISLFIKPHDSDKPAGGYFLTYRDVGINANSKVQAEAWDFLTFMMSEEIQTPPTKAGFPINKNAFAKQIKQLKEEGKVQAYKEGPLQGLIFKVDEAKLDQLERFVNGAIHKVEYKSDKVRDTIIKDTVAYFTGQKSANDVAGLIQNKVTTYLNE